MAATSSLFFLTACDRHGRSASGEPLIASKAFQCEKGYPCLPYGCGGESFAPLPGAERWLILLAGSSDDFERVDGGARVYRATIDYDGDREGALAYLRRTGAKSFPHIYKEWTGPSASIALGGVDSTLSAEHDTLLCAGARSRLVAKDFSVCVTGSKGKAQTGRFGVSVAGTTGEAVAGDEGVAISWNGGAAQAGPYGLAVGNGCSRIIVGEHALAVGSPQCHFKGGKGAVFIVRAFDHALAQPITATTIVGSAGIEPGHWYRFQNGLFEEVTSNAPTHQDASA